MEAVKDDPIQELQKHLKLNPGIERIYFNDKGQWQFHKRETYPIEKDRDQVLTEGFQLKDKEIDAASNLKPADTQTTTDLNQQQNAELPVYDITKKYNPKQMAAYINAAASPEEVAKFVREDNKPETAELIKQKLASFEKK